MLAEALTRGEGWLRPGEADALLAAYGIPHAETAFAGTPEEAGRLAAALGGPVAVKAVCPGLPHLSDIGAVLLGVEGADGAERAAGEVLAAVRGAGGDPEGIVVQRMAAGGVEMVAGVIGDPGPRSRDRVRPRRPHGRAARRRRVRLAPLAVPTPPSSCAPCARSPCWRAIGAGPGPTSRRSRTCSCASPPRRRAPGGLGGRLRPRARLERRRRRRRRPHPRAADRAAPAVPGAGPLVAGLALQQRLELAQRDRARDVAASVAVRARDRLGPAHVSGAALNLALGGAVAAAAALDAVAVNPYRAFQAMTDVQHPFGMRSERRTCLVHALSDEALEAILAAAEQPAAALSRIVLRPRGGVLDGAPWGCECLALWPPVASLDRGNVAWVDRAVDALARAAVAV